MSEGTYSKSQCFARVLEESEAGGGVEWRGRLDVTGGVGRFLWSALAKNKCVNVECRAVKSDRLGRKAQRLGSAMLVGET